MAQLYRVGNPIDREERANLNLTLDDILSRFSLMQSQINFLAGGSDIEALLYRINLAIANGEALNTQSQELIDELTPLLSELNDAISEVGNLSYIGVWDGVTTYEKLNIVSYNGESYIAKRNNTNITPVEGDDWGTISQRGQQGIQGEQGEPGQGLIILGLLPNTAALPSTAQTGDAYLVKGVPFNNLYVWVSGAFVDMGPFGSSSSLVKATQAQAIAGTDNDTYMTPLRVSEVVTPHFTQLEFQIPTILGTQIRLSKPSNSNRLFFRLSAALNGPITVSTDGGTTSRNLVNDEDVQLTTLDKGFYEIVLTGSFFTLRNKGGLSQADLDALITLTNEADTNDSTLRTEFIEATNDIAGNSLPSDSSWNNILLSLQGSSGSKKVKSGTITSSTTTMNFTSESGSASSSNYVTITDIDFKPTAIMMANSAFTSNAAVSETFPKSSGFTLVRAGSTNYRITGNAKLEQNQVVLPVGASGAVYNYFAIQ